MRVPHEVDTIVIGGGVVGMSIAYGLSRAGERVRLLDEGDDAFRAARGNFGLIWVQGKGSDLPAYAEWSMQASRLWAGLSDDLEALTGIDLQRSQTGGLSLCLDDEELATRNKVLSSIDQAIGEPYPFEILDARSVRTMCSHVGPDVVGASYGPLDGHVSPLRLLRALAQALVNLGIEIAVGQRVSSISCGNDGFRVSTHGSVHVAPKVVLAAGLGNKELAPMVGLDAPVEPQRGQILVSERIEPFLDLPLATVRQTGDGGVQIGDSKEDVGFDDRTTTKVLSQIAERAVRCFPLLADVNIIRTWGALRVMTPDGYPIYQASTRCPGAFVVTCHSGITLAPQHAGPIADWIRGGAEPELVSHFKAERFHV